MTHGFPSLGEKEKPTAEEDVVYSDNREETPDLRFLHYNDIYHLDAQSDEPVGGAARFQTLCNYYSEDERFEDEVDLITVFSGDAYNPSNESAVTRGSHMVPLLNNFRTDIACPGNHDFDFGAAQFEKLRPECNFPWVLTNVFDPSEGENVPLGHCQRTYIWEASNGIKIGFMGLAEREWAGKGNSLPRNLEYHEMIETAERVGPELREQGADIVIAMTHCRQPRDFAFGEGLSPGTVDLILAGHDHWWEHKIFDNGTHLVRSGSDFKMLSYIKGWKSRKSKGKWEWDIIRRYVVKSIEEDKATLEHAEKTMTYIRDRMERPVGYTIVPLEARDRLVRTRESNYANFVCDIMRLYYESDVAIITGGTIKGDQVHTSGLIRLKFIAESFPFEDPVCVIRITGKALWQALENGLSEYPDHKNGLFLQVSGMRYEFNPNAEPGKRVQSVHISEDKLDLEKKYTVALRSRLAFGLNNFDSLKIVSIGGEAEEVVPDEYGILISMLLRQYFTSLSVLSAMSSSSWGTGMAEIWGGIGAELDNIYAVREHENVDPALSGPVHKGGIDTYDDDDKDAPTPGTLESLEHGRRLAIMRQTLRNWRKYAGVEGDESLPSQEEEKYQMDWTKGICPILDGRIKMTEEPAGDTARI